MEKIFLHLTGDTTLNHLEVFFDSQSFSEIKCEVGEYNQVIQTLFSKEKKKQKSTNLVLSRYTNTGI